MADEKKLIGPYEIQGVIGSGGMGVVYRGIQPSHKRFVAIKVLPAHLAQNKEFVERFLREARSVASIDHPSIVTIYDIGESDGAYYFVMKFLVGDTLEEYIEENGRIPLDRALLFTEQLADALGAAHESGVIHRDVKPANIIVEPREQRVVLTDFGIALTLKETRLTRPGTMFGSPIFVAPEQLEGDDVDHRSDFYSLGSVLFQMLAGRPPYDAETPVAILHQRIREPEKSVRDINPETPEAVERMVRRLMARDPNDRYQTAGELLEALRALRENGGQPGPTVEPSPTLLMDKGTAGDPPPAAEEPRETPLTTGVAPLPEAPDKTMAADAPHSAAISHTSVPQPPAVVPPPDASDSQSIPTPPEVPPSTMAGRTAAVRSMAEQFGMRRIILAWIGVMAAVLIILMVIIWWSSHSGLDKTETELPARMEQPAEEEAVAGGLSATQAEEGLKESAPKTSGPPEDKPGMSVEPVAVSDTIADDMEAVTPVPKDEAVRPMEVTADKPPSDSGRKPRAPSPPSVTEAEVASALAAARASRETALEAGAPEHAPLPWTAGEEKMRDGAARTSDKRPDLEKQAYEEARVLFAQALEKAVPVAEAARKVAEAGLEELAGLGTRIEQGISAGTMEGIEDAGTALKRFREIAPEDTRFARYAAQFDDAELRLWQSHGISRTFAIAQGVEMKFIWIPPGTYRMGTTSKQKSTHTDEGPKHTVAISKGFWLGTFEVTQAQWQAVMGGNPSRFKGADHPVDRISWIDAQAFVSKLNTTAGAGRYRLPTEAEWEFACRAGTARSFCGGEINTMGCENEDHLAPWAWYCYNSGDATHPVGQKQPNGWGFHDMHGNVGEWCSDYYDRNYYEYSPTRDPQGPDSGKNRVLRGGSWDSRAWNARSAYRGRYKPSANNNSFGIRIVRTAD